MHAHMVFADALVKFDYDKQHDDEISLRTGDILLNVYQVSFLQWFSPTNIIIYHCHSCLDRGGLVCGYSKWSYWRVP